MSARARTAAALVVAALSLAAAGRARAEDDAGTHSIFAAGAGARGLGMGSAYAAVANDATAVAWNAGGLGWVERSEAHASTVFYGEGFREDFVSLAMPSWRWGTASLSIRRFGVNGIERRDERNVLLEEDLESRESETSIAFARPLGPGISVGGALKLQSQSVAGWSGSGIGGDLGVLAFPLVLFRSTSPFASRISVGMAARNVIEPRIRLDQETVSDPAVWRTGFAYRSRWGIAALDLERPSGAPARVHVGTEVTPYPGVALRAGTSGGSWTAGAGTRLRGFGIDYAYESQSFGATHRFGLSYAFGVTTLERREAAVRAEDAKLQVRLAEAFQRLERERVDTLLARADEARRADRFSEALDVLGTVMTLDPENVQAAEMELGCLREHAVSLERAGDLAAASVAYQRVLDRRPNDREAQVGQLRCRAESDRRAARTEEIRKAFAQAMDAFAADNLVEARAGFQRVVDAAPQDEDARAMLRRTEQTLAKRAESLVRQARRSLAGGQLTEASDLLQQARALDPSADGLVALAASIEEARRAPSQGGNASGDASGASAGSAVTTRTARPGAARAAEAPPPLTPQRLRELRDLYQRGLAAMAEKRQAEALRYFEIVWAASPKYAHVAEYLKREYLMLGLDAYSSGRLDEAVSLWEKAIVVDPTDARARGYLTRAQKQLERSREISGEARR